jgi:hypothetical protein
MATPLTLEPALPTKLVHQFPLPTWIENLAVRQNGQILVTILTSPELYLIDPSNPSQAILVHKFPDVSSVTGIIEVEPDIFYVAVGNFNLQTVSSEAGSYSTWEVDLRDFTSQDSKAVLTHIMKLPDSGLPNGFALLPTAIGTFLFADSEVGAVWKVDVRTRTHEIAVQVDEMKAPPPPDMPLGINGIKIQDGHLYWTNTGKKLFCRIMIDHNGKAIGETEILAKDTLVDDFVFDKKGNAWLAQNVLNTVGVMKPDGVVVTAAGKTDQLTVAGGTACQFGRREEDEHVLYLTTTGALAAPIGGTQIEGGKVVAIDTTSFGK